MAEIKDISFLESILGKSKTVEIVGRCNCGGNVYKVDNHIECGKCAMNKADEKIKSEIDDNIKRAEFLKLRRIEDEKEDLKF